MCVLALCVVAVFSFLHHFVDVLLKKNRCGSVILRAHYVFETVLYVTAQSISGCCRATESWCELVFPKDYALWW